MRIAACLPPRIAACFDQLRLDRFEYINKYALTELVDHENKYAVIETAARMNNLLMFKYTWCNFFTEFHESWIKTAVDSRAIDVLKYINAEIDECSRAVFNKLKDSEYARELTRAGFMPDELHLADAVMDGNLDLVHIFVIAGVPVEDFAIRCAVANNRVEILKYFLALGYECKCVRDAAIAGYWDIVKLVPPNAELLEIAIEKDNPTYAEYALNHGVPIPREIINKISTLGMVKLFKAKGHAPTYSTLCNAVSADEIECVDYILGELGLRAEYLPNLIELSKNRRALRVYAYLVNRCEVQKAH